MRTKTGRLVASLSILISCFLTSNGAHAYGTVKALGQDAEHERITRRAFACDAAGAADCFEKKTLNKLAGKRFTFGAVGFPDQPTHDLPGMAAAHCDGGDHLNAPGYPQSAEAAQAIITECRDWMQANFEAAVADAAKLLGANGDLIADQTSMSGDCIDRSGEDSTAKCRVLTHFGILLHAAQDFYSHSNWTDLADETAPTGPRNPPGLGNDGPAPWLSMPTATEPFPDGLITGCYEGLIEARECNYEDDDGEERARVKHAYLNKDKGTVDPGRRDDDAASFNAIGKIGPGKTDRGKVSGNFERSVRAAILDTRNKWLELKTALKDAYGDDQAALMICAITKDKPGQDCGGD